MDDTRFDAITKRLADSTSRRATVRLIAAGLLGGVLAQHRSLLAGAQRPDSDQDGLFDDDETDVYGTQPNVYDTDGDTVGDGEEIFNRDNGLGGPSDPLTPDGGAAAPAATCAPLGAACATDDGCCVGYCGQDSICGCQGDGQGCYPSGTGGCCNGQPCNADGFCGVCGMVGARCNTDGECCQGSLCCFNGTTLTTVCTEVYSTGGFCPGDAPVPGGCPAGQTDCGGTCVDLSSHAGHCGACFASCPLGGICQGGVCGGVICMDGLTDCGGTCIDLQTDFNHCGACGHVCALNGQGVPECVGGACADVAEVSAAPPGSGDDIDAVENKADPCHPRDDGHPNDVCMEPAENPEEVVEP